MFCNDNEIRGHKELHKLQSMLRNLEECNDLPSPEKTNNEADADISGFTNNGVYALAKTIPFNGFAAETRDEADIPTSPKDLNLDRPIEDKLNISLLENDSSCSDIEDDIALDDEDNWLLQSPLKASKKAQLWLCQDVKTPELSRVKGVLASKLDLISIQNRKEKLSQLLWKHNLGNHPDSAPGRLYPAESMCSVMSLDWEYDEDAGQPNYARPKLASAYTDSPTHQRFSRSVDEDQHDVGLDELQPMSLDFQSPPALKRSVQVAPGPVITRRGAKNPTDLDSGNDLIAKPIGGIRPRRAKPAYERSDSCESGSGASQRRLSLSDRSDSSGDAQMSPRNSVSSSRSSIGSNEDFGQRKSHRAGQERRSEPSLKQKSGAPQSTATARGAARSSTSMNRAPITKGNDRGDENLVVKLPAASLDGPVIRRRGASPRSGFDDNIPRQRAPSNNPKTGNGALAAPSAISKKSMPRPRTAAPIVRRSVPTPRGLSSTENFGRSQSPDVLPRRGRSPERRSGSPDVIPKRGVVPRGQAISSSYQVSDF